MTGQGGKKYWTAAFGIEVHLGLTEFKARIKWTDDVCFSFCPVVFVWDILAPLITFPWQIVYDESRNKE